MAIGKSTFCSKKTSYVIHQLARQRREKGLSSGTQDHFSFWIIVCHNPNKLSVAG